MSLNGFAPCESGRALPLSGRVRRVKGRAVYDSSAWLSTSNPVDATTCAGSVRVASGSPGFGPHGNQVDDRDPGALAAGSARRRARNVRLKRTRHGPSVPNRRVDLRHEVGGVGGVEIRRLGRVDRRTAADGNVPVELSVRGEARRSFERCIGRFDARVIVRHDFWLLFQTIATTGMFSRTAV